VQLALEFVEGDLAHDRIDHVLDLLGEHGLALGAIAGLGKQGAERQHFAEYRSCLGKGQRVEHISAPCPPASTWWTPWPSSWASVITSRGLPR
jgi:hypothetical protein